jgi:tetratricopeptide (TPR) repeat protein
MKPIISEWFIIGFFAVLFAALFVWTAGAGITAGGNPFIIFIALAPVFIIIAFIIYIYYQFKILRSIPGIQAPDHKIKIIKNYLRRNTINVNLPVYGRLRRKFLAMLVIAYADKGDYLAAFEVCAQVWKFFPAGSGKNTPLSSEEAAIYAEEIEVLIHLGRLKPAESLLRELNAKSFSDSAGLFFSKLSELYLLIYKGDNITAAREKLGQARAFMSDGTIREKFPMKDFKHTLLFLEAKLDMCEKKYDEARTLFTNITQDSRNYGNRRLAREELEYWTTRF